jgi:hypothetical protein
LAEDASGAADDMKERTIVAASDLKRGISNATIDLLG